ncbi:hypothetical protein ILYODFUR_005839 [Ilyodon furcidens]|uniref:Uncharacterized protein n=1 Tax=Ilyodon furcidens TaxID=33524 RepID=A0ABV0U318_9TELE
MLYLPRPPENSSGPWPRASNMGKAGRNESKRERDAVNIFFYVLIYSVLTLPLTLLLFLLKIKNTVSCFSSRSSVFEHNAPHDEEGLVQKANIKLIQILWLSQ